MGLSEADIRPGTPPLVVGSSAADRSEFQSRVEKIKLEGNKFLRTARAPRLALEEIVKARIIKGVGGDLQMGFASRDEFRLVGLVQPVTPGKPEAIRTLLGFNLDELGLVGDFNVGVPLTV